MCSIFAAYNIQRGGLIRLIIAGIFYVCTLQLVYGVTPVWNVNASTASLVLYNGSVTPFLLLLQISSSKMYKTKGTCLNVNSSNVLTTCAHETGKIFSFNDTIDVQVVIINNEPWFVAADVCRVLGLFNTTKALYGLDNGECLTLPVVRVGQKRPVNLINESGLYTLIFQSRKPIAQQFRKWVTSVVLPSIRKTGKYETKSSEQEVEHYKAEAKEWKEKCMLVKQSFDVVLSNCDIIYRQYNRLNNFKNAVCVAAVKY